jgi:adenosylcobinamide kinase/adenosylcobinamide-phosphate guanylyltransferase
MTKARITFVIGGARSGKSAYATELARNSPGTIYYVATAEPSDDEMRERIMQHQIERPAEWRTLEEPIDIAERIASDVEPDSTVIVDCLTVWLGNVFHHGRDESPARLREQASAIVERLCTAASDLQLRMIVVSNEVGTGLVPSDPVSRLYRDVLGGVNQAVADRADEVVLLVAGIPMHIKTPAAEGSNPS